ncbi:MAG: hypothetical protein H7138_27180 [Myxococcales bacterium]|nr:hypothetical protein [Myxococcales bacterium]
MTSPAAFALAAGAALAAGTVNAISGSFAFPAGSRRPVSANFLRNSPTTASCSGLNS